METFTTNRINQNVLQAKVLLDGSVQKKLISIDKSAMFVTWSEDGNFELLSPDEDNPLPMEQVELEKFFNRILIKKK